MKTIKQLARDAEDVQNACNLSGVLQSAAAAMLELRDVLPGMSTGAYNRHPIMRAWAHKIADLSGLAIDGYPAEELRLIFAAPDAAGDMAPAPYQPKTGAPCSCRRGIARDNCATCEGTGMQIDFGAIRARRRSA